MDGHNIATLPKWAQKRIKDAEDYAEKVKNMHALMCGFDDWFVIEEVTEMRHLFALNHDSCHAVCAIGNGDVLIVGRRGRKEE